jgi:aubergine
MNRMSRAYSVTRPQHINSKEGKTGTPVDLSANYFRIIKKPSFHFSLYRVDFEPEVPNVRVRKAFVYQQEIYLQGYLYDGGNMIYATHRLPDDHKEFEIKDKIKGDMFKMKIKYTGTAIDDTSSLAVMIFNTMLRRAMDGLKMELVGRNLYDEKSKVSQLE